MKASIIIPARNEGRFIRRCLSSLSTLDAVPCDLEIIVVDNGSTDNTVERAQEFDVTVIQRPGGRVGAVRNRGASVSTGDILAFIDADCIAPPRWLSAALDALADPRVGIVGGHYLPNPSGTWVERAWAAPEPPTQVHEAESLPGGSILVRSEVFEALGGFDETLSAGEDDDLCRRTREHGLSVLAAPECYVIHLGFPSQLRDVIRRQLWHGASQLDVAPSFFDTQLLLTHSFLAGLFLLIPGAILQSVPVLCLSALLLVIPVLALAGRKASSRRRRLWSFVRIIPIASSFYLGRAIGLLRNYARLVLSR